MIVYVPGCWDILHVGHVALLERAAKFGTLVVGVASDAVVKEDKGEYPIIPMGHRIRMLQALECVDMAVPYHELNFGLHLNWFKPDVFVVGQTWGSAVRHVEAETWCKENSCRIVTLPYSNEESTTKIKERIRANG